ncbi:MAG: EVE domain-containing protein [Cardiobacteriaceae bacterium]|nr:EVE domain-containing protein [Cardiobacteriaceae bacterium]
MKSEPEVFSIDDLIRRPKQIEPWDGVRNYQARNFMRQMRCGDLVFFYHSNAQPPGIAGIVRVVQEAYPDPTQFDPNSHYFDAKSTPDTPRWDLVDVGFVEKFAALLPLEALKQVPELSEMLLVRKGNRLSVMPVSAEHWAFICRMAGAKHG